MLKKVGLFFIICLFSQCATVFNGQKQWLQVITEPAGALVSSGMDTCKTPCVLKLNRTGELPVLQIVHPYCKDTTISLVRKWNETSAINCINPIFWVVDCFSGAYNKYKPLDTLILPIKNEFLIK